MQDMTREQLFDQLQDAERRGDLDAQVELLRQFHSLAQQSGDVLAEIGAAIRLGNVFHDKGQVQMAHSYRVVVAELAGNPLSNYPPDLRMSIEGDLGRSYIEARDWPKGEAHTRQALEMAESLHNEIAQCVYKLNLGMIYANTGRMQQTRQLAAEVLNTAERLNDHYILGLQHLNVAEYLLREARLNESQRHAREALAHSQLSMNVTLVTGVQRALGEAFRLGRLITGHRDYSVEAELHLQQMVELAQNIGNVSLEADAEVRLAQVCEDDKKFLEAANHYQRALDLLEQQRSRLGYEEFQLTYFQSLQPTYEKVIELLLRYSQLDQAFLTAERLRSRLLLALLGQGLSNTVVWPSDRRNELVRILNEYNREEIRLCFGDGLRSHMYEDTSGLSPEDDNETVNNSPLVQEARHRFLRLYEAQRLYRANWQPRQSPPAMSFEEAQRFLGRDDALVAYLLTDQSLIIFAATDKARHFQHLIYPREKLANDVEELCFAMDALQDEVLGESYVQWFSREMQEPWPEAIEVLMNRLHRSLEKLYVLLVAPVLAVVEQKAHWVIVPHGPLHRLPWAALRGADHYLIEQHSVSLLPSASVGAFLERSRPSVESIAVFFADPDPNDPRLELPETQREAQAVYEFFRAGPVPFVGRTATKQAFLEYASIANLLHLACHHVFDGEVPLLSFLKLSGDSGTDSLYAFEVTELNLSAELVSLSACQSGRSQIATGDEQYGIVRAFLAAGVRSVISTLWSIDDESAAAFFIDFYKNACKYGLSQALSSTQRRLLKDPLYELPCFWAAYILSGRWNKPLTLRPSLVE